MTPQDRDAAPTVAELLHEAEEDRVQTELADADAYLRQGMNESLSENLVRLDPGRRECLFTQAALIVEDDLGAGRPPDLLRAFTEAALLVDPAYDGPEHDPTRPASEPEGG